MPKIDLPFHPRTGLQAIGLLRNGTPIWPVLGGSGEDDDDVVVSDADDSAGADDADVKDDASTDADSDDAGQDDKPDDDKPLGPKGEKALQAEKDRRREADRQRRQIARERDEALAELAKLRKAAEKQAAGGETDADKDKGPDLDAIRAEAQEKAKAEVKAEVLKDRVSDKIEVLAAKRAQDPDVVRTLLLAGNEIADFLDGDKIDAEAIKEALDELLEKKPYLAVAAQSAKRFQGSGDGGARKGPQKPAQLNEADLRRMSAEQIVKAQAEGRFDDLLGASQ